MSYQASFLLREGGFQCLLCGELIQKFNAVNISRGGTPGSATEIGDDDSPRWTEGLLPPYLMSVPSVELRGMVSRVGRLCWEARSTSRWPLLSQRLWRLLN